MYASALRERFLGGNPASVRLSLLGRFLPRLGPLVTNKRLFFFAQRYFRIPARISDAFA
jgi:hypothetical protein